MPSTEVFILGQKYTIKGDAPEGHIRELAAFIEGRIKEVCGKFPNISPTNALILALFGMADEIHKLREEQDGMARHFEEKADILAGLLGETRKNTLF